MTTLTLTQIIYEQEKQHAGLLPRSILTGLVRAGRQALDVIINPSYYIDEQVIENALREQGVPRREDIQGLIYQVEALSTKIDEISRDHKSV
jgi:polyhydroxyalkanoate synthesis regulator protein